MSDCNLCVYVDADDYGPEVVRTVVAAARKEYRCCECREVIPIGARYERVSGKWESGWSEYLTCLACSEIRETFCCDGWIYGQLWERFNEYFEYLTTGCLDRLETAAAKAKLLDAWNRWRFDS